jgi:hypothetical protein
VVGVIHGMYAYLPVVAGSVQWQRTEYAIGPISKKWTPGSGALDPRPDVAAGSTPGGLAASPDLLEPAGSESGKANADPRRLRLAGTPEELIDEEKTL